MTFGRTAARTNTGQSQAGHPCVTPCVHQFQFTSVLPTEPCPGCVDYPNSEHSGGEVCEGIGQQPTDRRQAMKADSRSGRKLYLPRCFAAGDAGQRHKRTGRNDGGTPPPKAPWGVAAAGRAVAKNGSASPFPAASQRTADFANLPPVRDCDKSTASPSSRVGDGGNPFARRRVAGFPKSADCRHLSGTSLATASVYLLAETPTQQEHA